MNINELDSIDNLYTALGGLKTMILFVESFNWQDACNKFKKKGYKAELNGTNIWRLYKDSTVPIDLVIFNTKLPNDIYNYIIYDSRICDDYIDKKIKPLNGGVFPLMKFNFLKKDIDIENEQEYNLDILDGITYLV